MPKTTSGAPSTSEQRPPVRRFLRMTWVNALLLHWRIDPADMRAVVPDELEVDTWDGSAWLTVMPHRIRGVRPILGPSIPWFSSFQQVSVRACALREGEPAMYCFSFDASNPVAVWLGRTVFHLPCFRAAIQTRRRGDSHRFSSQRTHQGARPASIECAWSPREPLPRRRSGDLVDFLTNRQELCTQHAGKIHSSAISHEDCQLRRAVIEQLESTMVESAGLPPPEGEPIAHHCDTLVVEASPLRETSEEEIAAWLDTAATPPAILNR